MKRDMELIRKILFKIEEEYVSTTLFGLSIEGYDMNTVAYHCKLLYEAGFVDTYDAKYASNELWMFVVGGLTWEGHDFLDKIREDTVWNRTKEAIKNHGLPMVLDVVKRVSSSVISSMTEGAIKGLKG